jgi:3-dehydroquinate synthase
MSAAQLGTIRSLSADTPIYWGRGAVTRGDAVVDLLRAFKSSRHVLIADRRVHRLYGERLAEHLRKAGLDLTVLRVAPIESSKSVDVYLRLVNQTLRAGVEKGSHILTLGGGVVGNVGGFVAATVFRGLPLIHMPTSLMAQLDAAIDVRQSINHRYGKNLIGAQYAPKAVLVDPSMLATLPRRHLRSGYAEAIKHALLQSRAFWRLLLDNAARMSDEHVLETVVTQTIRWKLKLLGQQNGSDGIDYRLQYGHCLGHAIETASGYRQLHGEAIAIGMALSAEIAVAMGIASAQLISDHVVVLQAYGLPVDMPSDVNIARVRRAMAFDKYAHQRRPRLAVLQRIGRVFESAYGPYVSASPALLQRLFVDSQRRGRSRETTDVKPRS